MAPFTLFIVYHKILHEKNIENFSEPLLDSLCWVAVNEEIQEKDYPKYTEGRLIKEWEMKEYSPLYQMLHWQQNSVFHHLYKNLDLIKTKYVGFAQYDQKLDAKQFEELINTLNSEKRSVLVATFAYNFQGACEIVSEEEWQVLFLDEYNRKYKEAHTMEEIKQMPMFLLHTFIIPKWYFEYMMPFIEEITPKILKRLNWQIRHLAGTLERVYALFLACGLLEQKFQRLIHFQGIQQCDEQRTPDPIRGVV